MKRTTSRMLASLLPLLGLGGLALLGGCAAERVGTASSELTEAQCVYFDVDGKVTICHKTNSAKNPYTVLKISEQACIAAHTAHGGDYVAVGDPTCHGGGCLPQGAPCDATLPCCSGSTCQAGVCVQSCVPTTCEAQGATCGTISDGCGDTLSCGGCGAGTACQAGQCQNVDDCAGNPCEHGGTCTDGTNSYTCACAPGWTGANCEIDVDECASNPCVHGECVDQVNGYFCACAPGFTGAACEIDIDECASNPCVHGECVDQVNAYACVCAPGFTGTNCEIDIDECESNPCVHGQCVDQVNAYACTCDPGYTGTNCEQPTAATCPCDGMAGWGPMPDMLTCEYTAELLYLVNLDYSRLIILGYSAAYDGIVCANDSTGEGVTGLTAAEEAACRQQLLAFDTSGACAQCPTTCLSDPSKNVCDAYAGVGVVECY